MSCLYWESWSCRGGSLVFVSRWGVYCRHVRIDRLLHGRRDRRVVVGCARVIGCRVSWRFESLGVSMPLVSWSLRDSRGRCRKSRLGGCFFAYAGA